MIWLPVAAPEDPARRVSQGDGPLTADELREIASSYEPSYREAWLVCAYDPESGSSGKAHFESNVRPGISPILEYRFSEEAQELEARIDPESSGRLRKVFEAGWRRPSIGVMRFPDHPSGSPKWYGQHVTMVGPGEVEIIPGLGGDRWAERLGWADRFRAFQESAAANEGGVKYQKFRSITDEELRMPDEITGPSLADDKPEKVEAEKSEKNRALEAKSADGDKEEQKAKIRAVETDPAAEQKKQMVEMRATIAELAETLRAFTETAGDPAKIRAATEEAEQLVADTKLRAKRDHEARITREVESLSTGDEPRLRTMEVEFTTKALLAMTPTEAEVELEKFRARDPISSGLSVPFDDVKVKDLPRNFAVEDYMSNDGSLPGISQIRALAQLTTEGNGDPVAAAFAREKAEKMKEAYNG